MKWIPVSEQEPPRPEHDPILLVREYCIGDPCVMAAVWCPVLCWWRELDGSIHQHEFVTHWAPLPDPPEDLQPKYTTGFGLLRRVPYRRGTQ